MIRFAAVAFVAIALACSLPLVQASEEVEFNYDDNSDLGPAKWGTLQIENNQCSGEYNSPVAIETPTECDAKEDYIMTSGDCDLAALSFTLNSHGVKAAYPGDGSCTSNTVKIPRVDGVYQALQFHIHSSSEHSIDSAFFDFELHVVHQLIEGSGDGSGPYERTNPYAVVGFVLRKGGETNAMFDSLLNLWSSAYQTSLASDVCQNATQRKLMFVPDEQEMKRTLNGHFNIYDMLAGKDFYTYSGGLTTPPCSEAVWWNLNTKPVTISDEQANTLLNIITDFRNPETCELATTANPTTGSTSRPPQALNSRIVELYCPEADDKASAENSTASNLTTVSSSRSNQNKMFGVAVSATLMIASIV